MPNQENLLSAFLTKNPKLLRRNNRTPLLLCFLNHQRRSRRHDHHEEATTEEMVWWWWSGRFLQWSIFVLKFQWWMILVLRLDSCGTTMIYKVGEWLSYWIMHVMIQVLICPLILSLFSFQYPVSYYRNKSQLKYGLVPREWPNGTKIPSFFFS